ncbi:MAG: protein-glutamate O-methyltransferase CheR [Proteobacteria bacterium]|nr:protein-glutamate O-methyltransferase CheR [Pseudomonadota bacterium]
MIEPLTATEFERIRDLLSSVCGVILKDDQYYLIETRLADYAIEIGARNFTEFHQKIIIHDELLPKVVDLMTTNETLWFRNESCWLTLKEEIIPTLIDSLDQGRTSVRIWSAACSSGQEAYSLAILIDEISKNIGKPELTNAFHIIGTDISRTALHTARAGRYNAFSIGRGMSNERLERYFSKEKIGFQLSNEIRDRVEFNYFNLMGSFASLGKFDLILCRNVAIYFSNEIKKELFDKIGFALVPNGYLMLGATESLFGKKTNFEHLSYGNGIYFQSDF